MNHTLVFNPVDRGGKVLCDQTMKTQPILWITLTAGALISSSLAGTLEQDFVHPPASYRTRPLWFWNGRLSKARTTEIMESSRASGYGGFGILPAQHMSPTFMSPEFLDQYAHAVEEAARLGQKMCLYDEYWFPSGAAGGELARQFPEALSQRLDLTMEQVAGPMIYDKALPPGTLMAIVAMHSPTLRRMNLTSRGRDGRLVWRVPPGTWNVMVFTCAPDGARGLVNYLDPTAVRRFITLTYEKYYGRFGAHFGSTIDSAFYDEPTMHWVEGGRAWTMDFNRKFRTRHGYDPAPLYPALWFDIGPETAAARNTLFGFRAELYADGFVKPIAEWCQRHRIALTGHQDQEEVVNPVGLCGDLMKCMRDQDIPGVDQIFKYGRGSKAYKVISSVAYNYDRPLVMTECYGGIDAMPVVNLYKEAMDQFAKGINLMVPHAVWYDTNQVIFQPELSYRTPPYAAELPAYNQYMARLQRMLQGGRHVADIAILYPIATLQAGYRFGVGKPYEGGIVPPEADYMDVGEALALNVRRDFTFLHPDVLESRCSIVKNELRLNHAVNHEAYRAVVIPGSRVIRWADLKKIKSFYDRGGIVVATTRLPEGSAEFNQDALVRKAVSAMFPGHNTQPGADPAKPPYLKHSNRKGGKSYFIPQPTAAALQAALDDALPVWDVKFDEDLVVSGGNLSYIHKVIDGRQVYFFANSSDVPVNTTVTLRGKLRLERWNPVTSHIEVQPVEARPGATRTKLDLDPATSIFLVGTPE